MQWLANLIAPEAIATGVALPTKKALFAHLGAAAARVYGLNEGDVVERLVERERLGTTGFGKGVAIPHGKIEGLDRIVALFVRTETPMDFGAIDDLGVDLVFCLLSPPDAGAAHLKALAQVSRWLRDAAFVAKLRGAGSTDAIYALLDSSQDLRSEEARDAA